MKLLVSDKDINKLIYTEFYRGYLQFIPEKAS
jgi:hypothetical protein